MIDIIQVLKVDWVYTPFGEDFALLLSADEDRNTEIANGWVSRGEEGCEDGATARWESAGEDLGGSRECNQRIHVAGCSNQQQMNRVFHLSTEMD